MTFEKDLEALELHLGFKPLYNIEHPNPSEEYESWVKRVWNKIRSIFGGR